MNKKQILCLFEPIKYKVHLLKKYSYNNGIQNIIQRSSSSCNFSEQQYKEEKKKIEWNLGQTDLRNKV